MTDKPCEMYVGGAPNENLPCVNCKVPFDRHTPTETGHSKNVHGEWYIIDGINPEPWESPTAMVGRKNNKNFARLVSSEKQRSFQQAVRESFAEQNGEQTPTTQDIELEFYFWRQVAEYETDTGRRATVGNVADATNLQKALEDALQKILFKNDRQVKRIQSKIVEQETDTEPLILIYMTPAMPADFWLIELADHMREDLHESMGIEPEVEEDRRGAGDLF